VGRWPPTAHGHRRVTACGVVRARMDDRREPFKRSLWLTSGPRLFSDFSRFSILQTLKSKSMTFPMSKLCQFLQVRQLETHGATFLFGTTSNSLRISSYNFWNKFKFESSLNFRGVQTFLEKVINSLKFPLHMIFTKVNLVGYTCM
jgi:hypothetical protein